MSRRTETAYKAIIRASQHHMTKSHGFRRNGKCCGCVATVHVLIRGDLSPLCISLRKARRCKGCRDGAEVSRSHSRQGRPPLMAMWWLETSPVRTGKSYPAEGPNLKRGMSFSMSFHSIPKPDRVSAWSASWGIQLPKIITVTAVFSKNWDWK